MTDLTAKDQFDRAVDQVPESAKSAANDLKGLASTATDRVQQASEHVRRRVSDGAEVARDWAADQSDVLRDTVQTKPFIAIGVSAASAFAAGLVLGILLARR